MSDRDDRVDFFSEPATQLLFLFRLLFSDLSYYKSSYFLQMTQMFPLRQLQSQINFSRRCVIRQDQFHIHFVSFGKRLRFLLFFFLSTSFNFSFPIYVWFFFWFFVSKQHAKLSESYRKNYGLVSLFANLCYHNWGSSTILHINHPENKQRERICVLRHSELLY